MRAGAVAVVTGGSRGVGRAVAEGLAAAGALVATVSRSGGEALPGGLDLRADVSRPDEVDAVREQVEHELGRVAVLVNAAGVFGPLGRSTAVDPLAWLETVAVDLAGVFLACRAFAPGMVESGWGRIVNVTSASTLHPPNSLASAYTTSKVAVNHLTRCLAVELEGSGVTANVFHPGDLRTEMWADIKAQALALGPEGQSLLEWCDWVETTGGDAVERSAELVLRLCTDEGGSVNGRFLWIAGGLQPTRPSWGDEADPLPWAPS